jgi:hypothetical protein
MNETGSDKKTKELFPILWMRPLFPAFSSVIEKQSCWDRDAGRSYGSDHRHVFMSPHKPHSMVKLFLYSRRDFVMNTWLRWSDWRRKGGNVRLRETEKTEGRKVARIRKRRYMEGRRWEYVEGYVKKEGKRKENTYKGGIEKEYGRKG